MLERNIKIPENLNIRFCFIKQNRYFVINNSNDKFSCFLELPVGVRVFKNNDILLLKYINISTSTVFKSFVSILVNLLTSLKTSNKKTLLMRGLGLRSFLQNSLLVLKLGNSHDNTIFLNNDKIKIFLGKNFITLLSYDKVFLGNFVERIYRLKKANCYKSRGLYYKNKLLLTKIIKKT